MSASYVPPWKRKQQESGGSAEVQAVQATPSVTVMVKVGLDEWVVAESPQGGRTVQLCTDGLSGCVAVALTSATRAGLMHVFSGCSNDGEWEKYQPKIAEALNAMGVAMGAMEAELVYSDDNKTWLCLKLEAWLKERALKAVRVSGGSGIRLFPDAHLGGWDCLVKESDNAELYRKDCKNGLTAGTAVYRRGLLSATGDAADI